MVMIIIIPLEQMESNLIYQNSVQNLCFDEEVHKNLSTENVVLQLMYEIKRDF